MTGEAQNSGGSQSGLQIGFRDLYEELRRVSTGYERLDAKFDTAMGNHTLRIEGIAKAVTDQRTDHDKLEERVRDIEIRPVITPKAMWGAIGVLSAVIATIAAIAALALK